MMKPFHDLYKESGLKTLLHADGNTWLIILTRTLRMFAYGFNALILALFFQSLDFTDSSIGLFYTLTLLGDVALSLFLTLIADGLGRRKILLFGAGLMVVSGTAFAISGNYLILLAAAVVGVISPSGSEIGPFRAVEESMLAHLTVPDTRTEVMSWYVVVPAVGTSLGLLACGNFVTYLVDVRAYETKSAYHACFWVYTLCGIINMALAMIMTDKCELEEVKSVESSGGEGKTRSKFSQISKESRPTLYKLCALMSVDSLSSGMAAYSLINLYLDRKFGLPKSALGDTMSGVWAVSAFMNIWSSAIAKRIGLIRAMVFTHLPSAIFLALMPAPRSWWLTVVLLVARAALNSMDQAPRAAFISAIVKPEERTAVMGIVNVLKTASQSGGPSVTGALAGANVFWLAFTLAGSLKASYDLGLLSMFVNVRLHEHEASGRKGDYERVGQEEEELGRDFDVEDAFALGGDVGEAEDDEDDEDGESDHGNDGGVKRSSNFPMKGMS
jgi:predicted MFS family arabinose efflux permease